MMTPKWLEWVWRLRAIAQNGLTYSKDPYDLERFRQVSDIAAEIAAAYTDVSPEVVKNLFLQDMGPATPKVDVRAAIFCGDTILLVRESCDGLWTLPGGWVDVNESPSEAVVRETLEESGYQCRAAKLLALYDKNKHDHPPSPYHVYKLIFLCDLLGGGPATSIETTAVDFFPEGCLPLLSTSRITETQIKRLFEHSRHPDWQTDYD